MNQGGDIDEGMLGEFVSLYDTNHDLEDSHSVPTSHVNTDVTSGHSRLQNKDKEQHKKKKKPHRNENVKHANRTHPFLPRNYEDEDEVSTPPQQGPQQYSNYQQLPNYQSQSPQVVYVPVYENQNMQMNGQLMGPQPNPQFYQQGVQGGSYFQQPQGSQIQFGQQPQFVQTQFAQGQQFAQMNPQVQYVQQPMQYMQQIAPVQGGFYQQNVRMQMPSQVGMGLNQVPTLVYLS